MAGAKEISPDAAVAEISETELDIIFTLKKEALEGVFTALQLATGHWQAANVTPGNLESAKPDIKDNKLAFKKCILST